MNRCLLYVCIFYLVLGCNDPVQSNDINTDELKQLTARFPFAIYLEGSAGEAPRFIYANINQNIHIYRIEKGRLKLDWATTNLGSRAASLFVEDLYQDGGEYLVIATVGGRILIYELGSYGLIWENLQDSFDKIESMVSANIDQDPQHELIFIADSYLYIYDSLNKSLEWQSQSGFSAQEILVANVDDDKQDEIILNTGIIFDSRFYNIELQAETSFGARMDLIDINNDGFSEIVGELTNFSLRIFDVYAERELW